MVHEQPEAFFAFAQRGFNPLAFGNVHHDKAATPIHARTHPHAFKTHLSGRRAIQVKGHFAGFLADPLNQPVKKGSKDRPVFLDHP